MAAGEEKLRLVLSAVDRISAPLRKVNRQIESLTAPVRKVRNAFRSLAKEAHLDKLGAGLSKLAGWARTAAIAAAGAGAGLLAFTLKTAESADSLAEFTRLVGMSVEEFQQLQWAAKRAGIDGEVFSAAMKSLAKNVGAAQAGTGRLAGLLKKVAPTTLRQIKATKSTGEALEVVLGAMRRLPDVSKRNALATAAFGNSMLGLLATLSPEELAKFRKEATELGLVMDTKTATAAESLMDNVDALKASIFSLAKRIVESLFPNLKNVTDQLLVWIKANRDLIIGKGREWILKVAKAIETVAEALIKAVPQVVDFVDSVGGVKTVLIAIAAIQLAPAIASLVQLGLALGPIGWTLTSIAVAIAAIVGYRSEISALLGLDKSPTNIPNTAPQPNAPKGLVSPFADNHWAGPKVDVSGTIGIALTGKQRAEITSSKSMNPSLQFDILSRGGALAPQ